MKASAASAALTYQGNWFNIDGNPLTGVNGRETPVPGPVTALHRRFVRDRSDAHPPRRRERLVWVNADCRLELELFNDTYCPKGDQPFSDYQTGVNGKEYQVHWLVGSAPPPPVMRLIPGDQKVTILWDNFSEVTPDVSTLRVRFRGLPDLACGRMGTAPRHQLGLHRPEPRALAAHSGARCGERRAAR